MTKQEVELLRKTIVELAIAEIGVKEEGGNNRGARVKQYQQATWMPKATIEAGFAWCAAFTAFILASSLVKTRVKGILPCKDASAFGWEKWALKNGLLVLDETSLAKAGDFVIFNFSHIGIVIEDQLRGETFIITCEGNTNGKGERDSVSGDGVWRKKRNTNLVKSYLRFKEAV